MQGDDTDSSSETSSVKLMESPGLPFPPKTNTSGTCSCLVLDHTPILPLRQVLLSSHFAEG